MIRKYTSEVEPVRVYLEMWYGPIWTIGRSNYISDLIELAGGSNIFSDINTTYVTTTDEEVIRRNPEVIVLCRGMGYKVKPKDVVKRPGWSEVPAIKNLRIYVIEGELLDSLYRYPSPRVVVALLHMISILHPTLVPEVYSRLIFDITNTLVNLTNAYRRISVLTEEIRRVELKYKPLLEEYERKLEEFKLEITKLRSKLAEESKLREELQKELHIWQMVALCTVIIFVTLVALQVVKRFRR